MPTNQRFLAAAAAACPALDRTIRLPVHEVALERDPSAFQGWSATPVGPADALARRPLAGGHVIVLDFGEHLVGRVSLDLAVISGVHDAPVRLRLIFAELPAEAAEPFDPLTAKPGWLSTAWQQDEVITCDDLPASFALPRRYAFRYLRIEVIEPRGAFTIALAGCRCVQEGVDVADIVTDPTLPGDLAAIDAVARRTLRNCMHTVFEDGPKRDRRLWIGDLRLQALANAVTFRRFDLVKRSLYLLAAFAREDGALSGCCYERPTPRDGSLWLLDYNLLFVATLRDYLADSGDTATARDLYPVARRQVEIGLALLRLDLFLPESGKGWWLFVDWKAGLDHHVAEHGMLVYALRQLGELTAALGDGVAAANDRRTADRLVAAARAAWFDPASGLLRTAAGQVSYANQAWAVLSGIVDADEGARGLRTVALHPDAVRPAGPYLWHHVVHAQLLCGMDREALALLRGYWGGMVRAGATTFLEVYDPADQRLTPYGFVHANSACHAWSCTPAWFLRRWRARLL
nr:hypothetical protein [Planctomycetota bacterium]